MKIKRSDLPESVAAALEPRTFAQELPEDGQNIEVRWRLDVYERGVYNAAQLFAQDDWVKFTDGETFGIGDKEGAIQWRPVLELEDEPQKPQRKLPEPGEFFEECGTFAFRHREGDGYSYIDNETGLLQAARFSIHHLSPQWTPLSDLIAKAAKVEELEAELEQQKRNAEISGGIADNYIEKFESLEPKFKELEAKIKQQDEILDSIDMNKFRVNLLGVSVDSAMAFDLLMKLEARRKAREASE